jgi:hypothetical protein
MEAFLWSLIAGITAAFVTQFFTFRRFQSERWWDRKADAYAKIIEALHRATEHYRTLQIYEEHNAEAPREVIDAAKGSFSEIYRQTAIGAYVISDEAANMLQDLQKRCKEIKEDDEGSYSLCIGLNHAYSDALKEMRKIAKHDLGVEGGLLWEMKKQIQS